MHWYWIGWIAGIVTAFFLYQGAGVGILEIPLTFSKEVFVGWWIPAGIALALFTTLIRGYMD